MVERVFEPFDAKGHVSNGPLYTREDGKISRNIYGYDLADLVCQECVRGLHQQCEIEPHVNSGYSACACNHTRVNNAPYQSPGEKPSIASFSAGGFLDE